ncbi:MAG: ATP synthase F1 subunit gamma [Flavobacteriaceae bacterium]|nr:ATP synthase F1 subunit gamma [Flavobacteriaceae bacterium]OUX39643.1 MAG: ATP synthase F1 subunit gamma [Flavobacteriaceae bacterium TMED265]
MANLKEIRNRITSVSSTMQITSAMKMVSAAKLKKAQDSITAMRPYAETLTGLINGLSADLNDDSSNVYSTERPLIKVLVVAISSNRGLCGAFNSNITKRVKELQEHYSVTAEVEFITIGKKVADFVQRSEYKSVGDFSQIFDNLQFSEVAPIADDIIESFIAKKYDKVEVVYNSFKNAATQIVKTEGFLPLQPVESEENQASEDYIFEPSAAEIVSQLIPKALKTQLFKAIRDSFASEHGARMTAMHKATDNAQELKDQLKLTYNKARQAAITNEILEIVGGAEALNS